jgi:ribonuclease P protein component
VHDKKKPPQSLTRRGDFSCVFSKGRHVACAFLVLYRHRNGLDAPRLGLSASRKVGGAVTRNRVKRILREAVRTEGLLRGGYDYVVLVRPSAGQLTKPQDGRVLRTELAKLFKRLEP